MTGACSGVIVDHADLPGAQGSRVLRPYLPDCELLVTFWTAAETARGKPHGPALQAMRWIVTKLVDAGHPVWAEFR